MLFLCIYHGAPFFDLLGRNFELFEAIAHVTQAVAWRPAAVASAIVYCLGKMKAISYEKVGIGRALPLKLLLRHRKTRITRR